MNRLVPSWHGLPQKLNLVDPTSHNENQILAMFFTCFPSSKSALVAACFFWTTVGALAQGACNEIFISEVLEGSGNNKGIEFFNPTNSPIDLSTYRIQRYMNGELSANDETQLAGVIPAKGTWVLINGQTEDVPLGGGAVSPAVDPEMLAYADQLDSPYPAPTFANGDDALVLIKDSLIVDIFGKPGEDPGAAWTDDAANGFVDVGGGATWMTRDKTLRRKFDVTSGVTSIPLVFDTSLEWDTLPNNTWDGLGQHACLCGTTSTPDFQTSCEYIGDEGWIDIETGIYSGSELIHPLGAATSEDVVLHVPEILIDPYTNSAFAVMAWENLTIDGMPNGLSFNNFPTTVGGNTQLCLTYSGNPLELGTYAIEVSGEMVLNFFGTPYSIGSVSSSLTIVIEPNPNPIPGCTYAHAVNHSPIANVDDGSCIFAGCTDPSASNYEPNAAVDDGSCQSSSDPTSGCDLAFDGNADGAVGSGDLLGLLTEFGSVCEPEVALTCGDPVSYQGYDYATVLIGDQCWFAENLRNENYQNGDPIPTNLSEVAWDITTSGAAAVFGDASLSYCTGSPEFNACDESWSLNEYGRLYNWYAVDDQRGLCPSGWHVPTDGEWTVMTNHLGGESVAGGQMKTDYGWSIGTTGTNSSGFSGLPGGLIGLDYYEYAVYFAGVGYIGYWWSSSPNGADAWCRELRGGDPVYRADENQSMGFSVRCIKDSE